MAMLSDVLFRFPMPLWPLAYLPPSLSIVSLASIRYLPPPAPPLIRAQRVNESHLRLSCIAKGRNVALRPFPPIWAAVAQSESGLEEDLENEESTVHARCPTSPLVGHNGVNMNYKMSVPDY